MEFDKFISVAVEKQFPDFYRSDGPTFVAFVKAYYEWMEQSGYVTDASRNLFDYKDVDSTIDQFIDRFKNQFLVDFPAITAASKPLLVKRIKDFYASKGSTRGMELLFRLLFDDDITVYDPGTDILRASDGVWNIPRYIEVEKNDRSKTFINQQITGSKSGATAFVESVHTKVVNQRLIDVITISNIYGNFVYGELITNDGDLYNAPRVVGSLTAINITDGGANNKIGDVFEVHASTNGKGGRVRVTAVTDGTGRVTFKLLEGGSGYTTDTGQVLVSNSVLFTANRSNSNGTLDYNVYDTVRQALSSLQYSVSTPPVTNNAIFYQTTLTGYNGSNTVVATGTVVNTNGSNTLVVNITTGDFNLATKVASPGNTYVFTGYTVSNATATGTVIGSNTTAVGLIDITNKFYGNGAFITSSSNVVANVVSVSTGTGAGFEVGSLSDTEVVTLFTDFIGANNVYDVPYLNMVISGSNSNTGLIYAGNSASITTATNNTAVVGTGTSFSNTILPGFGLYSSTNTFLGTVQSVANNTRLTLSSNALANTTTSVFYYTTGSYGFPKNASAGLNNIIFDALNLQSFTIGTIASLTAINPGVNYNTNPFVLVRNDYVASYDRRNILLELSNKIGVFAIGDTVSQSISANGLIVSYGSNTGSFSLGEAITQGNGSVNAYATISSINSSALTVGDVRGSFVANAVVLGLTSNATANAVSISNTSLTKIAKGSIVSLSNNVVELKRTSFNVSFQPGTTVTTTSGGSGIVVTATQSNNSVAMGENASVSANVSIARGIATQVEIFDSGHGHQPGDTIELTSNSNPFAITGIANVYNQGVGLGYWENTRGMLNADKYIFDGNYYQYFSYEIQSRLSLDKYADILKQLAHVAGTRMYGKVTINSSVEKDLKPSSASITFSA